MEYIYVSDIKNKKTGDFVNIKGRISDYTPYSNGPIDHNNLVSVTLKDNHGDKTSIVAIPYSLAEHKIRRDKEIHFTGFWVYEYSPNEKYLAFDSRYSKIDGQQLLIAFGI